VSEADTTERLALTIPEAARRLGISTADVMRAVRQNEIPTIAGEAETLIPADAIQNLPPCAPTIVVESCVYFIRCGEFVKIGKADDLIKRFKGLRTSMPHDLELLMSLPGSVPEERGFHDRFAAHRHRGEWFRLEGSLAEFLRCEGCDV
jgi:hypothetical protein